MDCPVVIVGAGPVGLVAAMDLAYRGVSCILLEQRSDEAPAHPRCNTTSARTMEILRRLGCSDAYRKCGLQGDYPNDVTYSTNLSGQEIARYYLPPSTADAFSERVAHDSGWHSTERPHRASQFYLERVLRAHAKSFAEIDLRFNHEVISVDQRGDEVLIEVRDKATDKVQKLSSRFLIGCDGGRSVVRKQSGIKMSGGYTGLGKMQAVVFKSKDVLPIMKDNNGLGWMNFVVNQNGRGVVIAIDGEDIWLTHVNVPQDQEEATPETIDRQIKLMMGREIDYEVQFTEMWQLNRFVAETYRSGNVFLAGDAAHIWPPFAGHGMNTGIEDAIGITWMLAAVVNGWAPSTILDAYESERQYVGEKVSRAAEGLAAAQFEILDGVECMETLNDPGPEGEKVRKTVRDKLVMRDSVQFNAEGMNFGLHYDNSPLILYDDGVAPEYKIRDYTPSSVPGCRAPYFAFIEDGASLYDRLSTGYTLLRSDETMDVSGFEKAAKACGMPFKVIDIEFEPRAQDYYKHALVLVRPDDRVAWRGNFVPHNPDVIIDRVRGASS